ncbi:hypothetical protein E2562_021269 [Oryza meyeriana var. granulata]|uniref:Uncharacterized protein n=1 Tax=Oryza meyeriana var. granulata TaxID=110450 RepID=A0A6G1C005_9ORYZ|nr:hypothetical protein E2562_021269 [Oryza meyeriana var. granulata]
MATPAEALGMVEPATVWTPLYPGFLYDPARFRSMTEEGFVYDPTFRFGTEQGFLYDERGFRVETGEDVADDDIASFCARVKSLQDVRGDVDVADVETEEVAGDDDDALEEAAFAAGFSHIIDLVEEVLEEDETTKTPTATEHTSSRTTKGSSTSGLVRRSTIL